MNLREIKILQEIKDTNVVEMVDVFALDDSVNMVMEFCPFDLEKVIKNKSKFFVSDIFFIIV